MELQETLKNLCSMPDPVAPVVTLALDAAREILECQARRAEQCHVASGPEAILPLLGTGKVARVFLDPGEPSPGTKCGACGGRSAVGRENCGACGDSLAAH